MSVFKTQAFLCHGFNMVLNKCVL